MKRNILNYLSIHCSLFFLAVHIRLIHHRIHYFIIILENYSGHKIETLDR